MLKNLLIDGDSLFDCNFRQSIADPKSTNSFSISKGVCGLRREDERTTRMHPQLINTIKFWVRVSYNQLCLSLITINK
jgi:hypothetical protein